MSDPYPPGPPTPPPYPSGPQYDNPYWSQYGGPIEAPNSTPALVLGIVGVLPMFQPLNLPVAIAAIIVSLIGRSKVNQAPPGTYKTSKLTAGLVLGILGTIWGIVSVIVIALWVSQGGPAS